MIVKPYREGSTTYQLAIRNVINKDIKPKLTSFSNVSFVESYVIDSETGQTRYIFEIDGIDDYYLAFENFAEYSLYMALLLKSDSHVDLSYAVNQNSIYVNTDYMSALYVSLKIYYIVENNKLRAIGMSNPASTPELFMVFDGDYVCYSNYVYGPNSVAGILSNGYGTPSYSEIEKAIFRNCMADNGSGLFITIFENIFQIINNQFSAMGIACVSVEGVKYRQVCGGSVFVRDGEEE